MLRYTIICGFTIFTMFFGSGNLVFPIKIGVESENTWIMGFIGLFFTGILLPFLGLFVIKLHRGDYSTFFAEVGKSAKLILPFFILSLLGSFGVIPRCIAVAHGGIEYLLPSMSLTLFSILFCSFCFVICIKESWLFSALGKWMSPLLLICLILIILLVAFSVQAFYKQTVDPLQGFLIGFTQGYATMDLFAAFFFSSLVFKQIQAQLGNQMEEKSLMRISIFASIIGVGLLSLTYMGFVYMGSHFKSLINGVSEELYLPTIVLALVGNKMLFIVGIIIVLSCLTTAVSLNLIYARYLHSLLNLNEKWYIVILLFTTSAAFFMSLLDFKGITNILSPILEISYPGLIVLTCISILLRGHFKLKSILFYGTTLSVTIYKLKGYFMI